MLRKSYIKRNKRRSSFRKKAKKSISRGRRRGRRSSSRRNRRRSTLKGGGVLRSNYGYRLDLQNKVGGQSVVDRYDNCPKLKSLQAI